MYVPEPFRLDPAEIPALVGAWPFATVVTAAPGLVASHVPLVLVDGRLVGHLAISNPQAAALGGPALAIFHGPHAMVRSDTYREPHRHVPTWNYLAIHATGLAEPLDAEVAARAALAALQPDAGPDADVVARLARGIVGFAIAVERWDAKAKLSQNRDPEDRARVRDVHAGLPIAEFMDRGGVR